ncbi:EutP/PduV family microcompartment system protein [Streptococcus sp. ZJ93]|uniref:EutP/PduV family microcompartment system protein n=1 Tax=Streptococcus handemini TaxID=3161188 RepID=UPI0032ED0728
MKKRLLVIGPDHSSKKELVKELEGNQQLQFNSSIIYYNECILVPESYLRSPGMKKHIISIQQNAYGVLMVLHSERKSRMYPPNFAKSFRVPTIGVVIGQKDKDREHLLDCQQELMEAKVDVIYELDLNIQKELQYLLHRLEKVKEGNQ